MSIHFAALFHHRYLINSYTPVIAVPLIPKNPGFKSILKMAKGLKNCIFSISLSLCKHFIILISFCCPSDRGWANTKLEEEVGTLRSCLQQRAFSVYPLGDYLLASPTGSWKENKGGRMKIKALPGLCLSFPQPTASPKQPEMLCYLPSWGLGPGPGTLIVLIT